MRLVLLLCCLLAVPAAAQDDAATVTRLLKQWARFVELPTSPMLRALFPTLPRWVEVRMVGRPVISPHPGVHAPEQLIQQYGETRLRVSRSLEARFELEVTSPAEAKTVAMSALFSQVVSNGRKPAWSLTRVSLVETRAAEVQAIQPRTLDDFYRMAGKSGSATLKRFGTGPNVTLLFAAIHGDERGTAPLLQKLQTHLETDPTAYEGCTVVLCPITSPEGWSKNTRLNGQGIDANRNFPFNYSPGKPRGSKPLQAPESLLLQHVVQAYRPDKIVAVHEPFDLINYDGPAGELANEMHRASGQGIAPNIGYDTPGSFGTYAGVYLGIPTITLELPERGDSWETQRDALLRAIRLGGAP
jgi:murein peptide amidase A